MSIESVISKSLSSFTADIVGIFDQEYNEVFRQASIKTASVTTSITTMDHPKENGAINSDHIIINPTTITLPLLIKYPFYKETYQQIKQFADNATFIIVQTKAFVFKNQLIVDYSHEESSEFYNSIFLNLQLKEVQVSSSVKSSITPRNPNNISTVDRGSLNGKTPNAAQEDEASLFYYLFVK